MKVLLTKNVYQEIMFYVDKSHVEISGVGRVKRTADGDMLVTKVYLLNQINSSAATDIDQEALAKLMFESREDQEKFGDLNFWWHSHVNMGVFWSGTDMSTIKQFGKNGYLLSTVFNKKAEMRSSYYQGDDGFKPSIFADELKTEIYTPKVDDKEMQEKYTGITNEKWAAFSNYEKIEYFDYQRAICEHNIKVEWTKDYEEKCKTWRPAYTGGSSHGSTGSSGYTTGWTRGWDGYGDDDYYETYWPGTIYRKDEYYKSWNIELGRYQYIKREQTGTQTSTKRGEEKTQESGTTGKKAPVITDDVIPKSIVKIIDIDTKKPRFWSTLFKCDIEAYMDTKDISGDPETLSFVKLLEFMDGGNAKDDATDQPYSYRGTNTGWDMEQLCDELRAIHSLDCKTVDELTMWDLCVLFDAAEAIFKLDPTEATIEQANTVFKDLMWNVEEVIADFQLALQERAEDEAADAAEEAAIAKAEDDGMASTTTNTDTDVSDDAYANAYQYERTMV
jgi:hypothetical protein